MWIIFGAGAIITLIINLGFYMANKKSDIYRYVSLSFTALTVCDFYAQNKIWVIKEDWSALMDVVPGVSTLLWVLVIISILANGISLIKRKSDR